MSTATVAEIRREPSTPSGKPLTPIYFVHPPGTEAPDVMLCALDGILVAIDEFADPSYESSVTEYDQSVRKAGLITAARMLTRQLVERINVGPAD